MLSKEQNKFITSTGPETPMGTCFVVTGSRVFCPRSSPSPTAHQSASSCFRSDFSR